MDVNSFLKHSGCVEGHHRTGDSRFLSLLTDSMSKVDTGRSPIHLHSCEIDVPKLPPRSYAVPAVETLRVSGKGWSDAAARASCLGEAAERYSALYRGDETLLDARAADLGEPALDPSSLLLFSDGQYAARADWNAVFGECQYIPEPWERECSLEWTP